MSRDLDLEADGLEAQKQLAEKQLAWSKEQPKRRQASQNILATRPGVVEDWRFVSMVLDRFFLFMFTFACIFGTLAIICQSPSLYDTRAPVDQQLSEIPLRKNNFMLPPDIVRITLD
ncbi:conserved hypothetical protein [Culex quinquefasciatus]|uniref:Neurotransmitter-gated ion-channel transmembrane domain-containing protein n=1 Tax=Culex quinquefasciatus TaxID=7176 RepID=B0WJI2_CULQU|nr:conserved hypothetical protein [Culex quinquefasciatus]|eukprot:XP_001848866.1 conserved hypothetical protein [Culex quinquefasciatus]